jgi:hypothetical protein
MPADVQLIDGPPIKTEYPDMVMIGFNGQPGADAITVTRTQADYARRSDSETYDVNCIVSSFRGDTDLKPRRDRAFELVTIISTELKRDRTIGGAVKRAHLSVAGVSPVQATNGVTCTVRFTIHVDASTR